MAAKSDRRERAGTKAADRASIQRRARGRRRVLLAAAVVVVVAVGTALVASTITRGDHVSATPERATTAAPPWPAPSDPSARAQAAGLKVAGMEGTALHIHPHLSISVDGKPVTVPANIGIDVQRGGMSALHTHDTSGILHVESAKIEPFMLGQLFTEWGVALHDRQVGGYVDGERNDRVTVFVDGKRTSTPLPTIRLQDHQDIAIVITTAGTTPTAPAPFDWSAAG
ncbi:MULTISPECIES: PepSY domain-containing protein [unclassified Curtobacterium]|jgi:hypothetical protein|uniref:PepSY domain-containing protein n=1 Tax=unclassified Curtobacterium TaxID=257496 RepID=UPI000FBD9080|nr:MULTISPECIES: PepSY domain-containing protein [unclassified Curtobacterium]ROQ04966.1 hypothetical protein EDF41_3085 [Curtobacterium sp. PhB171]ROQ22167.1 hypothetical protein EDF40_3253 [Curtobacterium sp. PhB170]ROS33527.1 hypothetical protein EDF25_2908 [Curtobacterium sp. PhB131]ROS64846.1 hypothetical protein EDF30_3261 [Curtobacterium sp. PhB141]